MALDIVRQAIETERVLGDERVQALLRAEAIVSGAGRDPVRILMEEARFSLGNTEVQEDRVALDGTAVAQALYRLGDEGEAAALAAQANLSRVIDMPGAKAGMSCMAEAGVEHVDASYENGHMVFQIAVAIRVRVLALTPCEVVAGVTGLDGLETRNEQITSVKLSAQSGATAFLEGEARLPPALDARTALMDWCVVRVDDAVPDLGGVRVSGVVLAEALLGSGVPGRPVALVKHSMPFHQLVDMPDWLSRDAAATAFVRRLSTKLAAGEDGGMSLRFEAEMDIAVYSHGRDGVTALADAYGSGATDVVCEYGHTGYCADIVHSSHGETVRASMLLPEGAPSAGTVIATRVRPQIGEIVADGDRSRIVGVLETCALYLAAGTGALCTARGDMPFELPCPFAIADTDSLRLEVETADANALMNDRLELNCALRVACTHRVERTAAFVTALQETPARREPFGITLYWPGEGESLWEIGRRYRMPSEKLLALNGGVQPESGRAMLVRA